MAGLLYPAQLRYDADFAEEMGYRDHANKLRGCADQVEKLQDEVSQHIGWLKQYMEAMTEDNWKDMRALAIRQLSELKRAV